MDLVSVAALAENRVIGDEGEIPWESIPEDRRQYRERVADDPVILGRRTFESMLDDLPGSHQIVLSRSEREFAPETAHHAAGVEEAVEIARRVGDDVAYVLGGGGIYHLFQPRLDRMVLSHVHGEYEGDTYYPEWDPEEWTVVEATEYDRFTLRVWEREGESGN